MRRAALIKKTVSLDIFADCVCPWCFLGFRRLLQARDLVADIELGIHFRPFLLDPYLPPAGRPYKSYIQQKLGGRDNVYATEHKLKEPGEAEGIEFDFDAIETAPNTLDAHRVIHWAAQAEKGVQEQLVNEIFSCYFEQGQNIGRHDVLIHAAGAAGMRTDVVARLLDSDIDRGTIRDEAASAHHIGVHSVPCFVLDRKYVIIGAESAEALGDIIHQIADGFEPVRT